MLVAFGVVGASLREVRAEVNVDASQTLATLCAETASNPQAWRFASSDLKALCTSLMGLVTGVGANFIRVGTDKNNPLDSAEDEELPKPID